MSKCRSIRSLTFFGARVAACWWGTGGASNCFRLIAFPMSGTLATWRGESAFAGSSGVTVTGDPPDETGRPATAVWFMPATQSCGPVVMATFGADGSERLLVPPPSSGGPSRKGHDQD